MTMSLSEPLRGQLLQHETLAKYTSWRVGGTAERMYIPADKQDLELFIASLAIDEQVLTRDFSQPYQANESVLKAWLNVYQNADEHFELYELAEKLSPPFEQGF